MVSTIGRGVALFAALGGVLAGLAGTFDWPVVGTFFGALGGAFVGAAFGAVAALAMAWLARATRSLWAVRATSGAAALIGAVVYGSRMNAQAPVAASLVPIAAVVGALLGPLIAFGMEPKPGTGASGDLGRRLGQFVGWGAALGAGAGAVTGLVVGMRTHPPTAGFAAVEGALFGVVSGLWLGCLAAALVLLPRMRARR